MSHVQRFEQAFAEYVQADFCVALSSGTAALHTGLAALGVHGEYFEKPSHTHVFPTDVAVPPITMSATTVSVLLVGGRPVFVDVDPDTWLFDGHSPEALSGAGTWMPVSLHGLHYGGGLCPRVVDDAAQTLRRHNPGVAFTAYSFQKSKVLPLGEGGALVTDDSELARRARWFSSLGYDLSADSSHIDPASIKDPDYIRHKPRWW